MIILVRFYATQDDIDERKEGLWKEKGTALVLVSYDFKRTIFTNFFKGLSHSSEDIESIMSSCYSFDTLEEAMWQIEDQGNFKEIPEDWIPFGTCLRKKALGMYENDG